MKKLFIVANWKSNKTTDEAIAWLNKFENSSDFAEIFIEDSINQNKNIPIHSAGSAGSPKESSGQKSPERKKEIIICPSFTSLPSVKGYILQKNLTLKIGSQDISPFNEGAYTGEINPKQLQEVADYVIIGHSERRKNFFETDEMLSQKVQRALDANLIPIFCVQGMDTPIPKGVKLVAYEPIFAIGTGTPDTPEDAEMVAKSIKEKNGVQFVLYGGSVTSDDVSSFTVLPSVNGVLVGGASMDPDKFMQIIKNA